MLRANLGCPTTLFGRGPPRLDGPRRQSRQATRTGLPLVRDLRRLSFDVGLRTPRRAAQAQREGRLVALDGPAPRRRRRPRRAILMAPKVWEASGHLATFTDPLVDCRNCKERFRADQLPESGACPNCGTKDTFTEARNFNLMFKTLRRPGGGRHVGRVPAAGDRAGHPRQLQERADDDAARSRRSASRRSASRSATRSRPATSSSAPASSSRWRWSSSSRPRTRSKWYEYWCQERFRWYQDLGIPEEMLRLRPHDPDELVALQRRHLGRGVRVPVGLGRARGHREPHRLRPHPARASSRARTSRTSTRRRPRATSRT